MDIEGFTTSKRQDEVAWNENHIQYRVVADSEVSTHTIVQDLVSQLKLTRNQ
jgi:hypothetical protein